MTVGVTSEDCSCWIGFSSFSYSIAICVVDETTANWRGGGRFGSVGREGSWEGKEIVLMIPRTVIYELTNNTVKYAHIIK